MGDVGGREVYEGEARETGKGSEVYGGRIRES